MSREPRRSQRGRRTALLCAVAAVAVLALAGVACYPLLVERHWLRELRRLEAAYDERSPDDPTRRELSGAFNDAIDRLSQLRSARAVPDLLRIAGRLWFPRQNDIWPLLEPYPPWSACAALLALPGIDPALQRQAEASGEPALRTVAVSLLGARGKEAAIPVLRELEANDEALGPAASLSLAQLLPSIEIENVSRSEGSVRIDFRLWNETGRALWYRVGSTHACLSGDDTPLALGLWDFRYSRTGTFRCYLGGKPPSPRVDCLGPGKTQRYSVVLKAPEEQRYRLGIELFARDPEAVPGQIGAYVWSPQVVPATVPAP